MKNIVFLLIILAIFSISCGSHFNPRYYYNRGSGGSSSNPDGPNIGGGGEGLDPKDDPFVDYDGSRPWNDPDYNFKMDFDNYVIEAKFDGNNRPTYKLVRGTWNKGDESKNEYWYNGPDSEGGGTTIGSMKYYLYKGMNHLFASDSEYNKSDRLDRFYFYRFEGAAFGVSIKNCLIAIDTYSKLVFAFGVPSSWKKPVNLPGVPYAPAGWQAVENGWEAKYEVNTQDKFANVDGIQYFYEYDPVGVVKANGEIEIFQWCLDSIGNDSKYAPRVDGNAINLEREIAREGFAGRSPYMPIKVTATTKDTITITAKTLKNISARSKDVTWGSGKDPLNVAYLAYGIGGSVYNDVSAGDIELYKDLYADGASTGTLVSKLQEISVENYIDINSGKTYELKSIDSQSGYIDLASSIHKYNDRMYFADTAGFPGSGSGTIADRSQIKLHLKYDKDRQLFYIDSFTVTYDTEFTLERGQTKELTIRYKWMKGNDTVKGEEVEVTYTLKFESAQ